MNILVTGLSGFVGKNLLYFSNSKNYQLKILELNLRCQYTGEDLLIGDGIVHLAGKAHDLNNEGDFSEYYDVNTQLTIDLFNHFLSSNLNFFIFLSSVKAVKDSYDGILTEDIIPNPTTPYGRSKLLAETYIMENMPPNSSGKRVYILRPCMILGPQSKGNLSLLYKYVNKGFPWPLGSFNNLRSYCSIGNLCFVFNELFFRNDIESGIYNVSDDNQISTNELYKFMAKSCGIPPKVISLPKKIVYFFARLGTILKLPFNVFRLEKLIENYRVSNLKISKALGKKMPFSLREGLLITINSLKS